MVAHDRLEVLMTLFEPGPQLSRYCKGSRELLEARRRPFLLDLNKYMSSVVAAKRIRRETTRIHGYKEHRLRGKSCLRNGTCGVALFQAHFHSTLTSRAPPGSGRTRHLGVLVKLLSVFPGVGHDLPSHPNPCSKIPPRSQHYTTGCKIHSIEYNSGAEHAPPERVITSTFQKTCPHVRYQQPPGSLNTRNAISTRIQCSYTPVDTRPGQDHELEI